MIEYTISFVKKNGAFTAETIFVNKKEDPNEEQIELTNKIVQKMREDKNLDSVLDICYIGEAEEEDLSNG